MDIEPLTEKSKASKINPSLASILELPEFDIAIKVVISDKALILNASIPKRLISTVFSNLKLKDHAHFCSILVKSFDNQLGAFHIVSDEVTNCIHTDGEIITTILFLFYS